MRTQGQNGPALPSQEKALIQSVAALLRHNGNHKSAAAIRDLVAFPHTEFGPKEAVSALGSAGLSAGFGAFPAGSFHEAVFPLIALRSDGSSILVLGQEGDTVLLARDGDPWKTDAVAAAQFFASYAGSAIIARPMSAEERRRRNVHWFFGAFRPSRWLYAQVGIAALASNFLSLSTAIFTMTVYDRVIPNLAIDSLIALSIGVAIALSFDFLLRGLRARFIDHASRRADLEISQRLFDRLLTLTAAEQRQRTGAMAGVIREFETLREFFNSTTMVVLIDLPFVLFFVFVIYLVSGPLALVPLLAVPIVLAAGLGIQPFLARVTRAGMENGMNKQAVLVETLNGLETVAATGSGRLMKKRYEEALAAQSDAGIKARGMAQFVVNLAASVQQFAQVAVIVYGVYLIADGRITQGALIAAVILGGRALSPLSQLANALSRVNAALSAYRSLDRLIGGRRAALVAAPAVGRPRLGGEIEFRGVSFKYDGAAEPVLRDLSFKVPAGQKVALIGRMGSGKSTLVRLIAGLLEPTAGAVLIDGVDLRQIDPADLRHNIGTMLQDAWLFSGSVRENIQMGFHQYDDADLRRICKISGVEDFVGAHPQGYDLMIQERGQGLSGGQRQAINLARALLHDPPVLLLDEPTSAMDQGSERKVVGNLRDACAGKTLLAVTHRNPVLAMVDRVLILDRGRNVADQTPEQLGIKRGQG